MAETAKKEVKKVRLKVNIHLGGQRYAGKGSIISGSQGWLKDLIHSKQAEPVGDDVKDKIEDLEHVKQLTMTSHGDGNAITDAKIKQLTARHEETLKQALDEQAKGFQEQMEEQGKQIKALQDELAKKKDK